MTKNNGLVEISRLAFSPNNEVSKESVLEVLGVKARGMTPETVDWYVQLKIHATNYCKDRARQDLLSNAAELGLKVHNVAEIQKRWKACKTREELETMGKVIHEMRYELRFDKDVNNIPWKVRMETEFMKEHNLVYLDKEVEKEVLGCIARQATNAKNSICAISIVLDGQSTTVLCRSKGLMAKGHKGKRARLANISKPLLSGNRIVW
jgi:hypothetical protein